jgi:hypothetical protein
MSVNIDWERAKLDCLDRLSLKSYNSAESAIFCILELHKIHPFDPAEVVSIEADVELSWRLGDVVDQAAL